MEISWMMSSTSSSAFSTSMILIATAWPVRLSTLGEHHQHASTAFEETQFTLYTPFRSCLHLSYVRDIATDSGLSNKPMQFCLEYSVSGSKLPAPARISAAAMVEQPLSVVVGLSLRTYTLSVLSPSSYKRLSREVSQHHFQASVLTSKQSKASVVFRFPFLVQSTSEG